MANYITTDTDLTSVADAIRAKGGTSAALTYPTGFVSAIENIPTGGSGDSGTGYDVVFYDDLAIGNKIVAHYSASEFASLSAMPSNPDHSNYADHGISIPMTSQGWNWSLTDAKTYVAKYGKLNIGQMYVPTDGKSHYICYVPTDAPVERWNTEINISVSGGNVEWQVDNETTNTANTNISVTFTSVGWHDVKISAQSGVTYNPYYSSTTKSNELIGKVQKIISVYLGNNVTTIGQNSFRQLFSLTSITIPDSITSIGDSAFYNCRALTLITIPDDVTSIESSAFYSCYSLTSATIPDSVTSMKTYAFYNCYSLTSITIPDSVTSIGDSVIYNCFSLTSVTIPDSIASIGSRVFYNCYSLTSVTIPNGITSIGNSAFYNCYSLTSITIPDDVTSISTSAFNSCYSIKNIIMLSSTPPTLSNADAFANLMSDYSIIVPKGSKSSYIAAANWSSLADHIVEAT